MLTVVTPVAVEPVTLAEMKTYLRQGGDEESAYTADDALIEGVLIPAAREKAERSLRIFLAQATYDYTVQTADRVVRLGAIGIASVDAVTIHTDTGDVTLGIEEYTARLKADPAEIAITNSPTYYAVTVRFTTANATIARPVRLAMYYLVHHWYENREAFVSTGAVPQTQPEAYSRIIHHYKRHRL